MDWNLITAIATAIGTIVAAGMLVSGIRLYQVTKRDEYIARVRQVIAKSRAACYRMNNLMTYEITNEIVSSLVYSKDLELPLKEIYDKEFSNPQQTKSDFEKYLENEFKPITSAIHTPLLNTYEGIINDLETDSAFLQNDYPGLFRILKSIVTLFSNIIINHKSFVRDENVWKKILLLQFDDRLRFDSLDKLKTEIFHVLVVNLLKRLRDRDQPDIDDMLKMLDLTVDVYLSKDEERLFAVSRAERKIGLVPISDTKKITDDLKEAEKCQLLVLNQEQILTYRELMTRVIQRNEKRQ